MKEFSIEQKAKAYDEAIEKATIYHKQGNEDMKLMMETCFPELKESEDEKIRKQIRAFIKSRGSKITQSKTDAWLAWVDKQGEQKPAIEMKSAEESLGIDSETYNKIVDECIYGDDKQKSTDKVEPKFKVEEGKWYVCISQFCNCIKGRVYKATSDSRIMDDFGTEYDTHSDAYKYFRLWTIQDAKDGDVLYARNFDNVGGCIFLFNGVDNWHFIAEGDKAVVIGYCCANIIGSCRIKFSIQGPDCVEVERVSPATKEQRNTLMKAMADAGYTFDFEKKELKKNLKE